MVSVTERLDGTSTVLLLASPREAGAEAACFDLLSGSERPTRKVLNVLLTRRPRRRVGNWERHVGELPESFVILSSQHASEAPEAADVEPIGRPGNLTGIGVAITDRLAEWARDEPTAFCLHSATAQLQYADRERVYQFHHTLRGHLAERRTVGHVHMNPAVHDERTVETFRTLFDAVVEVDGEDATVTASPR